MNDSESELATPATEQAVDPMTWSVKPAETQPGKVGTVFLFALAAFCFGTFVLHSLLLGLVGSAMILAATADFWLGTVYKLDEEGASSRTGLSHVRILWKDVKRAVVSPVGIKLSPLEGSTRLAPFRGVFLRFGKQDRVRIEHAVRTLGGNDVRFVEGSAE